ncbi:MAG: LapA family protein [Gammaproteobacteria bacterium]|nr:LapA family protein [Gammaproteobacteria bacterium]
MRILSLALLLIVLLLGLSFAVLNADSISINYYLGEQEIPLSVALVLALVLGALLGILASLSVILRQRTRISMLNRTVTMTEKEITNLRSLPIKDDH